MIELSPRIVAALSAQEAIAAGASVASYAVGEIANGVEVLVQRARQNGGVYLWKVTDGCSRLNKSSVWEYPPELRQVIWLKGALVRKINANDN